MKSAGWCKAVAIATLCGLTALVGACTTGALAIEQCREIENARCEASVPCGIVDEDKVEECKRTYRDHCLHGIAGPEEPTAGQQQACLAMIDEAGEAARDSTGDEYEQACEIISEPWDRRPCAFLLPSMGGASGDGDGDDGEDE